MRYTDKSFFIELQIACHDRKRSIFMKYLSTFTVYFFIKIIAQFAIYRSNLSRFLRNSLFAKN